MTQRIGVVDSLTAYKVKVDGNDRDKYSIVVDSAVYSGWGKPKFEVPDFLRERYNWFAGDEFPESKGIVLCSLVKGFKTCCGEFKDNCGELKVYGNVIEVPQFGKVYLGEVMLRQYERQVTMLRLELGSPSGGVTTGPTTGGGGTGFP